MSTTEDAALRKVRSSKRLSGNPSAPPITITFDQIRTQPRLFALLKEQCAREYSDENLAFVTELKKLLDDHDKEIPNREKKISAEVTQKFQRLFKAFHDNHIKEPEDKSILRVTLAPIITSALDKELAAYNATGTGFTRETFSDALADAKKILNGNAVSRLPSSERYQIIVAEETILEEISEQITQYEPPKSTGCCSRKTLNINNNLRVLLEQLEERKKREIDIQETVKQLEARLRTHRTLIGDNEDITRSNDEMTKILHQALSKLRPDPATLSPTVTALIDPTMLVLPTASSTSTTVPRPLPRPI